MKKLSITFDKKQTWKYKSRDWNWDWSSANRITWKNWSEEDGGKIEGHSWHVPKLAPKPSSKSSSRFEKRNAKRHCNRLIIRWWRKKHFLFLTAICHKGGKSLEIRGFFSTFFAGINFRGFNKIEYFAGTHFWDFKISTTKVYRQKKSYLRASRCLEW